MIEETGGVYVLYAFISFALVEITRYPYYLMKMTGFQDSVIGRFYGHMRYNLFIVFYPLGAYCDLMAGIHSLPNVAHMNYELPNKLNIAFDYQFFIGRIAPLLYITAFPLNYQYLLHQRTRYYDQKKQ